MPGSSLLDQECLKCQGSGRQVCQHCRGFGQVEVKPDAVLEPPSAGETVAFP